MSKTALILLDLQQGLLDETDKPYLAAVANVASASRSAAIPVIYVTTSFRPNHPEIPPRNPSRARVQALGGALEGSPSVRVASEIAPQPDVDIIVTKRRVSAFMGSDLDVVLRGLGVGQLVVAGISTSGAVLSTVRQAADLDFGITVLGDLCINGDEEVHRVLVEKVFPKQARVLGYADWVEEIKKNGRQ